MLKTIEKDSIRVILKTCAAKLSALKGQNRLVLTVF